MLALSKLHCSSVYATSRQASRRMLLVRAADGAAAPAAQKVEKITKTHLKEIVKDTTKLTAADTTKAVDALLDAIMYGVAEGKEVAIPGFGTFKPRQRKERKGRNPKTGEEITIEARTSPAFVAGKAFKDLVANGVEGDE